MNAKMKAGIVSTLAGLSCALDELMGLGLIPGAVITTSVALIGTLIAFAKEQPVS